jgi:uncharacterized protein YndB with AHSA1/START domain
MEFMMVAPMSLESIQFLRIEKEIYIAAPIEVAFESLLEELGPESQLPDGTAMPMVIEAWPGGRWFRDLGKQSGHLWGHVQVIKPPKLLEITGQLFMSYPAANHMQYRLATEGIGTKLSLLHRAFGDIPADHREGVHMGWQHGLERIKLIAESKSQSK